MPSFEHVEKHPRSGGDELIRGMRPDCARTATGAVDHAAIEPSVDRGMGYEEGKRGRAADISLVQNGVEPCKSLR